jgi:hypothetical protein
MHDQQLLPDATNSNTHLRIGNGRGEALHRKRPPSAPEIPRYQGPGVLKIGVVHKEKADLKTALFHYQKALEVWRSPRQTYV